MAFLPTQSSEASKNPRGKPRGCKVSETLLFVHSFLYSYSYSYAHANHRVVTSADEAHHLNMSRNGGGTSELCVAVHTTHGIRHAVRSRTCCHVIRMERTTRAAAGCNGEILLALLDAFLLVAAGNRMLEASRVRGVTSDGDINIFLVHDGNAFLHAVSAIAFNFSTDTLGISDLFYYIDFILRVIILGLYISKAVDAGNDLCSILAKTVQDDTELVLADLVGRLSDTDCTLSSCEGFVASEECEAASIFRQKHGSQIAMAKTYLAVVSNGTRNTESLEAFTDSLCSISSLRAALLDSDCCAQRISPASILKADRLDVFYDLCNIDALVFANFVCIFNRCDTIFFANFIDFVILEFYSLTLRFLHLLPLFASPVHPPA